MKTFAVASGIGYLLVVVAILVALKSAKDSVRTEFDSVESRAAWDTWRRTAEKQAETPQSVRRSIPRSSEPPTLVLLRDHFGVCVAASVTISSALYWATALFLRGALTGPKFQLEREPPG